uniref:Type 1 phosphatases regulator n=1 Tax=Spongospora subterranea TaxID=70186 RepID=A0A0H5R5S8_9EUKA|eukprot:CRZ09206.1 hypothetical protein [Spongospora subterranea]
MASTSSRTVTVVQQQQPEPVVQEPDILIPLHLRRSQIRRISNGRSVQFSAETVDNENMNKKKSKKCCIFHKKRAFGESDTESDSESSSSGGDGARPTQSSKRTRKAQQHAQDCINHNHHEQ